ncbi:hypothetical protein Dsin_013330 [Dipteronia sinensis]|uniref:RNase H type-1 domain-containing protein n=1 Tax=Dipteronia sinensis TaxID=43782 RepID=A0AAE0AKL9_9ROSI|nr:hypothetical protein Dsin_013330 [Dipteronia sinensis]
MDVRAWGNPGSAGIGGVLRDHRGKVLCIFSGSVRIQDAITDEILAIAKACDLFGSDLGWLIKTLFIASDSKTVVEWVNNNGVRSIKYAQSILDIRNFLERLGQASVVFCSRLSNSCQVVMCCLGVIFECVVALTCFWALFCCWVSAVLLFCFRFCGCLFALGLFGLCFLCVLFPCL